jgi:hypothetical protein
VYTGCLCWLNNVKQEMSLFSKENKLSYQQVSELLLENSPDKQLGVEIQILRDELAWDEDTVEIRSEKDLRKEKV